MRIRFRRVTILMRSLEDYFALTFVAFIAVSFESIPFQLCSSLNSAEWPQFCDHSVTSADVRLASANLQHGTVKRIITTPVVSD